MGRSRRIVVDGDNEYWIIREVLEVDPEDPPLPGEDHEALDPVLLAWGDHTGTGKPVFWGTGLISFGPVTAEQVAFMAAIDAATEITDFPGDFVAVGWRPTTYNVLEYGIREGHVSQYVKWGDEFGSTAYLGEFSITDSGIVFRGAVDPGHFTGYRLGDASFEATSATFIGIAFTSLNIVEGTAGADLLQGGDRPETLRGLDGNDTLTGGLGGDIFEGGAGHDLIKGGPGSGYDRLSGGGGNDTLTDVSSSGEFDGGGGDDLIDPGPIVLREDGLPQSFDIDGGGGVDRVVLDYSSLRVLAPFLADGVFDPALGAITNVEAVDAIGGGGGDLLVGDAFADRLNGEAGNDVLVAGGGDDTLDAGTGVGDASSVIVGGPEAREFASRLNRMFSLLDDPDIADATVTPHVTIELTIPGIGTGAQIPGEVFAWYAFNAAAGDTVTVDVDVLLDADVTFSIEDAAGGVIAQNGFSAAPDAGSTNIDAHLVYQFTAAGDFYLRIEGQSFYENAADAETFQTHVSLTSGVVLTGDRLAGGRGDDLYYVYRPGDEVVESSDQGHDTIVSRIDWSLAALSHVEDVRLAGAALSARGNARDNLLTGNARDNDLLGAQGNDTLRGEAGNDTLAGAAGEDILTGGAGADELDGGSGTDWASYADAPARVTADLQVAANNRGEAAGDSYIAIENLRGGDGGDALRGDGEANILEGGGNRDNLVGRGGDDTLIGGHGRDGLTGGAGADQFRLTDLAAGGPDSFFDFSAGEDTIALDSDVFGLPEGALNPARFVTGTEAGDANDRLIYNAATGRLFFDSDGTGAQTQVLIATNVGLSALGASDFVVI